MPRKNQHKNKLGRRTTIGEPVDMEVVKAALERAIAQRIPELLRNHPDHCNCIPCYIAFGPT